MTNDAGGKEAFYRYDPYGQPRQYYRWSDHAKANALMYVGLPRDFSTGLIRMGARWYDPSIARFTTADPSGQEQNPYLYAAANPINNVDPSGLANMEDFSNGLTQFAAGQVAKGYCLAAGAAVAGCYMGVGMVTGAAAGLNIGLARGYSSREIAGEILQGAVFGALGGLPL